MDGARKKSKKRSDANLILQPDQAVFFLDRNLGRYTVARALCAENIKVEVHDDHFPEDALDEEWIKSVAENSWIAVTKDDRIRHRTAEINAIRDYKARVIIVVSRNATGREIAEILLKGHKRIIRLAMRTPAPFIAKIYRGGSVRRMPEYLKRTRKKPGRKE